VAVDLAPELLEILACPNMEHSLLIMTGTSWSAWRPTVAWPIRYGIRFQYCSSTRLAVPTLVPIVRAPHPAGDVCLQRRLAGRSKGDGRGGSDPAPTG
jgi:uncharacterized protein YbaR (Trm112 family)